MREMDIVRERILSRVPRPVAPSSEDIDRLTQELRYYADHYYADEFSQCKIEILALDPVNLHLRCTWSNDFLSPGVTCLRVLVPNKWSGAGLMIVERMLTQLRDYVLLKGLEWPRAWWKHTDSFVLPVLKGDW